jgi:hypothetical protein
MSMGVISRLGHLFLDDLERLHEARTPVAPTPRSTTL